MKNAKLEAEHATLIAEDAKSAEERFIANMSHEIRTPLNGIIGLIYLLKESKITQKQKEYIDSIKISSDNLLKIINGILDFSKIKTGKIEFENTEFSLEDILKNVNYTLKLLGEEKGIEFSVNTSKDIPKVLVGDPTRLTQILVNIAGNAIKFTDEGSVKIDVEMKAFINDDVEVMFSIKDTGIGIPKDKLGDIFESYKQASCSTVREYGGTGLGLSIVKQLVELQGGHLKVTSEVGKGSTFTFLLRYRKVEKKSTAQEERVISGIGLGKEDKQLVGVRILLVEDNEINTLLASDILTSWQIKVDTAENGKMAIEKIEQNNYDLVLMDLHMPVMDGLDATKHIRSKLSPPKSEVPIIAMTASIVKENLTECLEIGMNDYIGKPFKPKELYRKISMFLGGKAVDQPENISANGNEKKNVPPNSKVEGNLPQQGENKILDLSLLLELPGGDADMAKQVISMFLKEMPIALKDLHDYLDKKEWDYLSATAHNMKSPSRWLGLNRLGECIDLIEKNVSEKPDSKLLSQLVSEISKICKALQNELKGRPELAD